MNWKNWEIWKWLLYQLWLVLLVLSPKYYERDWRIWKLEDEWSQSKLLLYWKRPEYREESWRPEKTCRYSNSSERPSANNDVKISQGVNNDNSWGSWSTGNNVRSLNLTIRTNEKTMYHENDRDTNFNWGTRHSHQRIGTRTGRLRNKKRVVTI